MKTSFPQRTHAIAVIKGWVDGTALSPDTGETSILNAEGDGTTDDSDAFNEAIAEVNAAGGGTLVIPAGDFLITDSLDAITVPCSIVGQGMGSWDQSDAITQIICNSQTAVVFQVEGGYTKFANLAIRNTYAGVPTSASRAIKQVPTDGLERIDLDAVGLAGFYNNLEVGGATGWTVRASKFYGWVNYAAYIRNTVIPDAGDWVFTDNALFAAVHNSTSGLRIESSGGGKIGHNKFNKALDSKLMVTGIDIAVTTGAQTSVLTVTGNSIENVSGDAIRIAVTGTARYGLCAISGNQVALYGNNTGYAVKLSAASTGGVFTNGGLGAVVIGDLAAATDGTARPAISLTNTDIVTIGALALKGWSDDYTGSGDTNTTVLGTGSSSGSTVPPQILLESGSSVPFTFDEILQESDGSDFLWASG